MSWKYSRFFCGWFRKSWYTIQKNTWIIVSLPQTPIYLILNCCLLNDDAAVCHFSHSHPTSHLQLQHSMVTLIHHEDPQVFPLPRAGRGPYRAAHVFAATQTLTAQLRQGVSKASKRGNPGRTSSMEDRHKTTSCKLGKNFSNSTYRMEIGNLGPTTSKLIIKEFRAWNALTWCFWKGFGMIGHRYRSCRGLGISDPTWKRKNLPHNSCNSTSSHPIWVMCHPKVNFFKLPKTAWKMFQEISNGIPLFPEPL